MSDDDALLQCPFCESKLAAFKRFGFDFPVLREKRVVGAGVRENCLCPICGSMDRERLVFLYLLHRTQLFTAPMTLLHVAPERQLAKRLARHANIDCTTADLNRTNVAKKMDVEHIECPDDSFDAIICNHVLEHVPNDRQAMRELRRVLKPAGWAILQVPISYLLAATYEDSSVQSAREREQAFGQSDHVRIYGSDYVGRLEDAGFAIEVFDWTSNGAPFDAQTNRFALNRDEKLFVVTKSASGRSTG